jgi:hypothetical protein
MKPKYKVTGCARFFIFFLFFVPIVYFGAAYFRGEDGWQKLKDFFNTAIGKSERVVEDKKPSNDTYRIEDLQKELDDAKTEIRELKNIIKEKDKEIARLKSGGE